MVAIEAVTTTGETAALCQGVGLARATLYRRRQPVRPSLPTVRAASSRALIPAERQAVLDVLHSERFVDHSPAEVHATLLEEQTYLCSTRTMYRILDAAQEVRERRDQARHPAYAKPELVATAPNQIWSWDITKLKGPIPYLYYSLYVILDLFSRYVVGWMVATHENARLAQRLIEATCLKQGIGPHQLTIHADRGAPMRSKLVAELFSDLRIDASHSRPRVSNDNPFSEAQFRTLKYRPEFPDRFGAIEHARSVSRALFTWYNDAHHHSGLSYLTPADVHYGRAATILEVRHHTRLAAYAAHPERFVHGSPRREILPQAVWINPPAKSTGQDAPGTTIVTPDDPQAWGDLRDTRPSRTSIRTRSFAPWSRYSKLLKQVVSKSLTRPARSDSAAELRWVNFQSVTSEFFDVIRLPFLRGRTFAQAEETGGAPVVVVSQSLAAAFWPGRDPLGQRLWFAAVNGLSPPVEVIGVVADAQGDSANARDSRDVFFPVGYEAETSMAVVVRGHGPATAVLDTLRVTAQGNQPPIGFLSSRTLEAEIAGSVAAAKLIGGGLSVLGMVGLLMALAGLYGVTAQLAAQRRRELGIRKALGATNGGLCRMLAAESSRMLILGIGPGIVIAVLGGFLLRPTFANLQPLDWVAIAGVSATLLLTGIMGAVLPFRKVLQDSYSGLREL